MDELSIGFIGGCIHKQPGIANDKNYISVLKDLLAGNHIPVHTHTASYLSYNELTEKASHMITKKKVNIICVFIRPFPLLPLNKLLLKYNKTHTGIGWSLHPGLLKRSTNWPRILTEHPSESPVVFIPKPRLSLRDVNLFIGTLCMRHQWAMKYLAGIFTGIQAACKQSNTQFVLISPPKDPGSVMGNLICKRTANYFHRFCTADDIAYVNINTLPASCFMQDKIHVNEIGHHNIAHLLHESIHAVLTKRSCMKPA